MICVDDEDTNVLVVSEKGYGKRSEFDEYRETSRGAKGVKTIAVTEKTGRLISIVAVKGDEDLMIVTRAGITIRMSVEDLRVMGRATQGVRLINLREGDDIASVAKVISEEDKNDEVQEVESPSGDAGEATQEETV
jgi:DNA gyrase subunit A